MHKTSGSGSTPARVSDQPEECFFITLRGLEYLHAQRVLEVCGGNRTKAAKILGIEGAALGRYLNNAGLR
jgi:DNA-binding protein Fis